MTISIRPLQVTALLIAVQHAETVLKNLSIKQWHDLSKSRKSLTEQVVAMSKVINAGNQISEDEPIDVEIYPVSINKDVKLDGFQGLTILFEYSILKLESDEGENKPIPG